MIAFVILLRERECFSGGNKLSKVGSFIILRFRAGLPSFNKNNSAIVSGIREIREKNNNNKKKSQISYLSRSLPQI